MMITKKLSNYLSLSTVAVLTAAVSFNAHARQGYGCQGYNSPGYNHQGYNDRGYYGKGYSKHGYYGNRRYGGVHSGAGMGGDSRYINRNYGGQGYGYNQPGYGPRYQQPAPSAYHYGVSPRAEYLSSATEYEKADVNNETAVGQTVSAPEIDVLITGMQYKAATHKIKVGEKVVWRNADAMPHTVTSTDGGPLNSGQLGKGGKYSFTFKEPGTYSYYCSYHPSMKGTVIVE
jgi:amicyanin